MTKDALSKKLYGTCKNCKRWYRNAPNYDQDNTEWICGEDFPEDGGCDCYLGVDE